MKRVEPAYEKPTPYIFFLLFCEAAGWRQTAQYWEEDKVYPRWVCRSIYHVADVFQSIFSRLWDWKVKPNG